MNQLLKNVILAIVIAAVTWLGCVFLGGILATVNIPVVVVAGSFLKSYASAIGILAGVWFFFTRA